MEPVKNDTSKHVEKVQDLPKTVSVGVQTDPEYGKKAANDGVPVRHLLGRPVNCAGLLEQEVGKMRQPSKFLANKMSHGSSDEFGALFKKAPCDMEDLQKHFLDLFSEDFEQQLEDEAAEGYQRKTTFGFLDVSTYACQGVENIIQDSFSMCFECMPREHWAWNVYLFPAYLIGVVVRYLILFPLRVLALLIGVIVFFIVYLFTLLLKEHTTQLHYQQKALQFLVFMWIASLSGVIKYHGQPPPRRSKQVYVANHSTALDIILILNYCMVCLVGQRQQGIIGFFQKYVLTCMSNLWFNRLDAKDRSEMHNKIKSHIEDVSKPPLLVFPEGTCVNNEYAVMFKRGAFDLDAEVVPIAIKYNRMFGDAFWNSRLFSFPRYVSRLMTSWCVVAEVWFLEPQRRMENETAIEFAARVKNSICEQAGLIPIPWDGYLKYFRPSEKEKKARQVIYADVLCHRFGITRSKVLVTDNLCNGVKEGEGEGEGEVREAADKTVDETLQGTQEEMIINHDGENREGDRLDQVDCNEENIKEDMHEEQPTGSQGKDRGVVGDGEGEEKNDEEVREELQKDNEMVTINNNKNNGVDREYTRRYGKKGVSFEDIHKEQSDSSDRNGVEGKNEIQD